MNENLVLVPWRMGRAQTVCPVRINSTSPSCVSCFEISIGALFSGFFTLLYLLEFLIDTNLACPRIDSYLDT